MWYLPLMEERLSEDDKNILKSIYAPRVVGVPPSDSRRNVCVMPDGRLRSYGFEGIDPDAHDVLCYLESCDCGLSWKYYRAASPKSLGSATRLPWSGRYVKITSDNEKTYCLYSDIGPDDPNPKCVTIAERRYIDQFLPKIISGNRLAGTMSYADFHNPPPHHYEPTFIYSDDDGESWTLVPLKPAPRYVPIYPSVDPRWENNGAEPVVTELPDGRLMILARTSLDYYYVYYSNDRGETWTDGELSHFHATLTTPYLLEMSDGRRLLFWNNTQPMPEVRHDNEIPPHEEGYKAGWEDVFTNRDISHCAYSTDGEHWEGFRELFLNTIRNAPDYRVCGEDYPSGDKSCQQYQALELPFGKVLVSVGQGDAARRLVIFDPDWLKETKRVKDFQFGLADLSTHMYVKSVSGSTRGNGLNGHCFWNRTNGPLLVPNPDLNGGEVLQVCRIDDPRLYYPRQGVVWNFPMTRKGEVTIVLRRAGKGVRIALCDHWFNPVDVTTGELSPFHFALTEDTLRKDRWYTVKIAFDVDAGMATVTANDQFFFYVKMRVEPDFGISYLHIQTDADAPDPEGTYLKRFEFEKTE